MRHSLAVQSRKNEAVFRFWGLAPSAVFERLPELRGKRIHVSFQPKLTAHRGKLFSNAPKGESVYAGCFLRKRRIILEQQMLRTPRILERIFVHEVFHFVWSRLGVTLRGSFEALIASELDRKARGELGWSAESMKLKLTRKDREERNNRWKDYICESFCDTAGWLFGSRRQYSEMTLARTHRERRRRWFEKFLQGRELSV
jgi:hypothetical protein